MVQGKTAFEVSLGHFLSADVPWYVLGSIGGRTGERKMCTFIQYGVQRVTSVAGSTCSFFTFDTLENVSTTEVIAILFY